jgi:DNA (cytosine-5)-methyltransferase 1
MTPMDLSGAVAQRPTLPFRALPAPRVEMEDPMLGQAAPDKRAIHDLFAAAGGWERGLELLGIDSRFLLGFEWSPIASTTARLAGFARLVADVSKLNVEAITEWLRGLIGSPPCQSFSTAGNGSGVRDIAKLLWAIREIGLGRDPRQAVVEAMHDARSALVLEPLRWALHLRPTWTAWEQVPAVLPLWEACAEVLRRNGYSAWAGILHAEQYDVPQARARAVLLASQEDEVRRPVPVRSRYHRAEPGRLDAGLEPWLSMGDVLPHRVGQSIRSNYGSGGDSAKRGVRRWDQPAFTVTSRVTRNKWSDGTSVTIAEASRLQTFPAAHPWYGVRADDVSCQIGDAVPPILSAHCLAAVGVGDLDRARAQFLDLAGVVS